MLRPMMQGWAVWLLLVGIGVGAFATWLLLGRLGRDEDDVTLGERRYEADWIGSVIERHGGVAPRALVQEVLDLHAAYLHEARTPPGPSPAPPPGLPPEPPPGPPPGPPIGGYGYPAPPGTPPGPVRPSSPR